MSLSVLRIDAEVAARLADAVRLYQHVAARKGYPSMAKGVADFRHAADVAGRTGGELIVVISDSHGTDGDVRGGSGGTRTYRPAGDEVLTQRRAAAELRVHPRTVRRWIDEKKLQTVMLGGRRRVHRDELDRLMGRRST